EYSGQARKIIEASEEITDVLKAQISLVEAEAMIGQGFYNAAIDLLKSHENFLAGRAVEKETYTEGGAIKTRRVPEDELYQRFNDYAKLLTLKSYAYGKKGRISLIGDTQETADGVVKNVMEPWIRGKSRYLGDGSIGDIEYRYL